MNALQRMLAVVFCLLLLTGCTAGREEPPHPDGWMRYVENGAFRTEDSTYPAILCTEDGYALAVECTYQHLFLTEEEAAASCILGFGG